MNALVSGYFRPPQPSRRSFRLLDRDGYALRAVLLGGPFGDLLAVVGSSAGDGGGHDEIPTQGDPPVCISRRRRGPSPLLVKSLAGKLALLLLAIAAGASPARAERDEPDPVYRAHTTVKTDFAGAHDIILALVAQPDGKVVAGGEARVPGATFGLVRYLPDGELDRSFGDGGKVTTKIALGSGMTALALQPDGKLVAAGWAALEEHPPDMRVALVRYLPDGQLDESFGEQGVVVSRSDFGRIYSMAIQPDGRIVVAGEAMAGLGDSQFVVARYLPGGELDPTFGAYGILSTDFSPGLDAARAVLLQPDGRIVAAGSGRTGSYAVVARYLPDGELDPSFGAGGKATTTGGMTASSAALQPDGRIVLAGGVLSMKPELAVARLLPDGSPDRSFGEDGQVTTLVGRQANAHAVLVQPNGKIVAAGAADTGANAGQFVFVVVRYRPDGTLDPAFHDDGIATTDFSARADYADALTIDSTGHLIAGGLADLSSEGTDFAVAGLDRPLLDLHLSPAVPPGAGRVGGAGNDTPKPADALPRPAIPVPATGGSKAGAGGPAAPAGNERAPVVSGRAKVSSAGDHRPIASAGATPQAVADVTAPPGPTALASDRPPADEMGQATLQFAPTGRGEPRPDSPNGLIVFLAASLLLVVGTATVTLRPVIARPRSFPLRSPSVDLKTFDRSWTSGASRPSRGG